MRNLHRKHLFHLVQPSPWPLIASIGAFFFVSGLSFYIHSIKYGFLIFALGFIIIGLCAFFWFRDISQEASYIGFHSLIVKRGLKNGFYMFILSEVMLFAGFFWAFFHSSFCPSIELGSEWPPVGIVTIYPYDYPLFNTFLLITSGFSVTWAHKAFAIGSYKEAIDSLIITISLGFFFVILQMYEYYEATFNMSDSVYACTFYMLTGLHGCHVIIGAFFIFFCFLRLLNQHFLTNHYLGFVFSIWYWHFVDLVWIFLFLTLYCWGSW